MIDLVVCSYRTPGDLSCFVESLVENKPKGRCNLVIMNVDPRTEDIATMERVVRRAVSHGIPAVGINKPTNVGYNSACNEGAALGKGEFVGFFNADVELTPGAIDDCVKALREHPRWGILGPRQVDSQNRFTAAGIIGTTDAPRHRLWHQQDTGQASDVIEDCPTIAGSAMFVRREVIKEVDGKFFGPMFHFWGETLACYMAASRGWVNVYYGPVKVIHEWHQASPVGGLGEQAMESDQALFRQLCSEQCIPCD